jgi:hypothetical protein
MDTVTISKTVQILFTHKESGSHILCKVDIKKLNWKLQKLQREGMMILGLYFEEMKTPVFITKGALTGRLAEMSQPDGSVLSTLSNGEQASCSETSLSPSTDCPQM